jgi:AcrR family transcriptional regulator
MVSREMFPQRQLQADETRAKVFRAAVELFAQKGYHETTVAEISRRAGVAKGTFFVHFATKDAVVTECVRLQTRAAFRAREKTLAAGGSPLDALVATALELGAHAGASKEVSRAVLAATLENAQVGGAADELFRGVFAQMIADARAAQECGLIARVPDGELLARALMASYLGAALHFCSSPEARPLAEVLGPLVEANLAGFRISHATEGTHAKSKSRRRAGRRA